MLASFMAAAHAAAQTLSLAGSLAETDAVTRAAKLIVADREAGTPLQADEEPFRLV